MRKTTLAIIAMVTVGLFAFKSIDPLPIGSPMPKPESKLKDISGKEVELQKVKKQNGILVMFTCNTCPYVIKNQQRTIDICSYADKMEIGVILLNSNEAKRNGGDSFEDMKSYGKDQKYKWYYAVDENSQLADAFGANRTPECFLFDKDLKLVYHGAIDDNPQDASNVARQHLKEAINELTSGKEVSVKETKSVGCTIKRKTR